MRNSPQNLYKKLYGKSGEDRAVKFLRKKGYKILERNYTANVGEADIIAAKKGVVVFVEVKTRVTDSFGRPAEAVGPVKQRKYRALASLYTMRNGLNDCVIRFDVIEILGEEINHIENAF